jgi:hypothetical protein
MAAVFLVILAILAGLYLVPAIIAWIRGHDRKLAITALNILLGWSVLGWVGALLWSLMSSAGAHRTIIVDSRAGA